MGAITTEVVETGERSDRRGRRVTPSAQRVRTVQAFQSSGMTMAAFARREGINYTTLSGWVMRLQRSAPSKAIKFAEVRLPLGAGGASDCDHLEVRLPDARWCADVGRPRWRRWSVIAVRTCAKNTLVDRSTGCDASLSAWPARHCRDPNWAKPAPIS